MNQKTLLKSRAAAIALVGLNLIVILAMLFPAKASVSDARYQLTPAFPFFPGATQPPPGNEGGSLLAASMTVEISKRFIGQAVAFREVVISDAAGKELDRIKVTMSQPLGGPGTSSTVQIQRQLEVEVPGPEGSPVISRTPEPVTGRLVLYPFEAGIVGLQIIAPADFEVEQGSELQIEVIGKSGLRRFRAKGKMVTLLRPGPEQLPQP